MPIPVVTTANGVVSGIGANLMLTGYFFSAVAIAVFLQALARVGLRSGGAASFVFPLFFGRSHAAELLMIAVRLPAKTGAHGTQSVGYVNDRVALKAGAVNIPTRPIRGSASPAITLRLHGLTWRNALAQQPDLKAGLRSHTAETRDSAEGFAALRPECYPAPMED